MDPVFDQAASDAEAICACLGPLAIFAIHAERLARAGAMLKSKKQDQDTNEIGVSMLDRAAATLKEGREKIDQVMQLLGDYFNNGDACSEMMETLTEPVYEILRKRKLGESLDG